MISVRECIKDINRSLKFTANAVVEGFITGLHQSPYHGFSVEFSDHKAYTDGDDVALIDWKLFGKTDRYYIKRFEDETNVRTYFLLDCSESMKYKSNEISKIDYARLLCATFINLSLKQRDATGLTLFNDKIISSLPAKTKLMWLDQCLMKLDNIKCEGQTNISEALFKFGEKIKKRSFVVIITDFLDDIDKLQRALNYLNFNRHHCVLFHIVDNDELSFDFKEEADFIDIENNETIKISPWILKKEYLERFEMFHMKLKMIIEKLQFEYCQINTNTPLDLSLKAFLKNRAKRI